MYLTNLKIFIHSKNILKIIMHLTTYFNTDALITGAAMLERIFDKS